MWSLGRSVLHRLHGKILGDVCGNSRVSLLSSVAFYEPRATRMQCLFRGLRTTTERQSGSISPAAVQIKRDRNFMAPGDGDTGVEKEAFMRECDENESFRNIMAYSLAFADSGDAVDALAFSKLPDARMREQLAIAGSRVFQTEFDHLPLPRTLEEALRPTQRAIVITETKRPFKIVDVNQAWEGLCGYSFVECQGRTLGTLLRGPETDPASVTALMSQLLRGEEAGTVLTNYKKDGSGGASFNRLDQKYALVENKNLELCAMVRDLQYCGRRRQICRLAADPGPASHSTVHFIMGSNDAIDVPLHHAEQQPSSVELSDSSVDSKSNSDLSKGEKKTPQGKLPDVPPSALQTVIPLAGLIVWPLMLTLPLLLSSRLSPTSYAAVFPSTWYEYDATNRDEWPKPLGLTLGILAVAVGQVFVLIYFYLHKYGFLSLGAEPTAIQSKGAPPYEYSEGVATHFSQPEGFVLLATYLSVTWMFHLMPAAYYSFEGSIMWRELALCLVIQDGIQYTMHRLEHVVSPTFYQKSHKPHHKFTNPRLFDAFNGSLADTFCMILIPLYATANFVRNCNVWTYMAFGSTYANWLTLIHSEYVLPWDGVFRRLGFGTPGDHHVHHKFFKYNYGHLFMWFDQLCGTYRNPREFTTRAFNEDV